MFGFWLLLLLRQLRFVLIFDRYALVIEDSVIKSINTEPDHTGLACLLCIRNFRSAQSAGATWSALGGAEWFQCKCGRLKEEWLYGTGIREENDLRKNRVQPCVIFAAHTCDFLLVLFILLYVISTSTGLNVRYLVYLGKIILIWIIFVGFYYLNGYGLYNEWLSSKLWKQFYSFSWYAWYKCTCTAFLYVCIM